MVLSVLLLYFLLIHLCRNMTCKERHSKMKRPLQHEKITPNLNWIQILMLLYINTMRVYNSNAKCHIYIYIYEKDFDI
jgi:hypothetical protein